MGEPFHRGAAAGPVVRMWPWNMAEMDSEATTTAATAAAAASGVSPVIHRRGSRGRVTRRCAPRRRSGGTLSGVISSPVSRSAAASLSSIISWPPSRALRWLREAGPRRRDTATAPGAPYAAFGPAAAARQASRRYTCASLFGPFQVGDELLGVGPRHHGHQLPALVAPVVQDLLGGVHQQGHGRVLPLSHSR